MPPRLPRAPVVRSGRRSGTVHWRPLTQLWPEQAAVRAVMTRCTGVSGGWLGHSSVNRPEERVGSVTTESPRGGWCVPSADSDLFGV